jgi:hypothetical protein
LAGRSKAGFAPEHTPPRHADLIVFVYFVYFVVPPFRCSPR